MIRLLVLLGLAPLLAGCVTTGGGSVKGGECKVFEPPTYVVLGKSGYDQDWIDSTIEGGVGGCRWKRPASRPAELDAAPTRKTLAKPARKRSLLRRVKDRVWPAKLVAPIEPLPGPPAAAPKGDPVPVPVPIPKPMPLSAVEELLHLPAGQ